ncbi:MAG TPA: hypothetical protein VK629_14510 [Steroidobacteraceae bacterium]|nr:hypothetical protein [Steroidobacteraceae bacterium]
MGPLEKFAASTVGGTLAIASVALLMRWAVRKAKKRSSKYASFYWGLLFYGSGRMPPPPPQTHIEQENREKKNRNFRRRNEDAKDGECD